MKAIRIWLQARALRKAVTAFESASAEYKSAEIVHAAYDDMNFKHALLEKANFKLAASIRWGFK